MIAIPRTESVRFATALADAIPDGWRVQCYRDDTSAIPCIEVAIFDLDGVCRKVHVDIGAAQNEHHALGLLISKCLRTVKDMYLRCRAHEDCRACPDLGIACAASRA